MTTMLTFSHRYFMLFLLKKHFLIRAKALHSMRKCLTVQGAYHVI